MSERFTRQARDVVSHAEEEARRLDDACIEPEHLLLGLLRDPDSVGAKAIVALGVPLHTLRADVQRIIGRGNGAPKGLLQPTARTNTVLELSLREATRLRHNYIGTEHIVLGLVCEGDGAAARILVQSGANLDALRQEVLRLLATGAAEADHAAEPPQNV
jgi:ATP-dependent Clp protease ATP-binding subunit ClpC